MLTGFVSMYKFSGKKLPELKAKILGDQHDSRIENAEKVFNAILISVSGLQALTFLFTLERKDDELNDSFELLIVSYVSMIFSSFILFFALKSQKHDKWLKHFKSILKIYWALMISYTLNGSIIFQDLLAIDLFGILSYESATRNMFIGPLFLLTYLVLRASLHIFHCCFNCCLLGCIVDKVGTWALNLTILPFFIIWLLLLALNKYSNTIAMFLLVPNALNITFTLAGLQ